VANSRCTPSVLRQRFRRFAFFPVFFSDSPVAFLPCIITQTIFERLPPFPLEGSLTPRASPFPPPFLAPPQVLSVFFLSASAAFVHTLVARTSSISGKFPSDISLFFVPGFPLSLRASSSSFFTHLRNVRILPRPPLAGDFFRAGPSFTLIFFPCPVCLVVSRESYI